MYSFDLVKLLCLVEASTIAKKIKKVVNQKNTYSVLTDTMLEESLSEELQFPELLLSTDKLVGFEEKLKVHCLAIRAWENSVPAENKNIEHYLKMKLPAASYGVSTATS